jgi:hypothetical protein
MVFQRWYRGLHLCLCVSNTLDLDRNDRPIILSEMYIQLSSNTDMSALLTNNVCLRKFMEGKKSNLIT